MFRNRSQRHHRWDQPWLGVALALVILLGAGGTGHHIAAESPLAVDLLYFRGESGDNQAFLEWETGTESDTAGYLLERATASSGPFISLEEIGFIPAKGSVASGALYTAVDDTALNGQTYWYRLVEITTANTRGDEWTYRLEVSPEPTAQIIGGSGSSATSTLVPTSTIQATATRNGPTSTPEPSPTLTATGDAPSSNSAQPTNPPRSTSTPRATATATPDEELGTNRTPTATATPGAGRGEEADASATAVAALTSEGEVASAPAPAEAEAAGGETSAETNTLGAGNAEAAGDDDAAPLLGGRSIGEDDAEMGSGDGPAPAQQEEESSSLLLWVGFLAALFIFIGGVAFSIYLSTRNRRNDLP